MSSWVDALDRGFYEIGGLAALRALLALVLGADDVPVDAAVAVVARVDELAATGAAADRALQVVLVVTSPPNLPDILDK